MSLHPPTLLVVAATILLLATVVSMAIGLKQRRRGMRWWFAANCLLAAGLVLRACAAPDGVAALVVAVLTLQWPSVTLAGIRRFYARGGTRIAEWADQAMVVAALLIVGVSWAGVITAPTLAQLEAMLTLSLTLYAASALGGLEEFAGSTVLKTLRVGMVAGALVQVAWLAVTGAYLRPFVFVTDATLGTLLATAAIALLVTQLAPVMNLERRITHLLASQRKLRNLVDVDALTRLPNRRHFHELAERAVEAARDAATMIVFDVDQLKRINELLGHATGDEALRQIGTALRETLRRRDVAGRLGGDEFAVVLPRTRLADSAVVVSRIIARLDDRQVAPRIARVTLNVGAVQFKSNETIGDALRRADAEMVAKRDAARRGEPAAAEPEYVADEATPTPSALMSLIPVGEVKVKVAPAS